MYKVIRHYGTPRRSGRYPWGSGDDSEQRNPSLRGQVKQLKKHGAKEVEIAKGLGLKTTTELRKRISIEKAEARKLDAIQAIKLKDKGYSVSEIGRRMGRNESSVRSLLNPVLQERANITKATAQMLKESIDKKNYVDIGVGMERHIGVSRTKLKTAVAMLQDEGYGVHYLRVPQLGTDHKTSIMVLAKPGIDYKEVYKNRDKIKMVTDHYTEDGGRSWLGIEPIKNISSKRIEVRYGKEGKDKDGIIELRRGVDELALGKARYAQVRIGVDGSHYLKGMAMYSDDLPKGIDIMFNSSKHDTGNKLDSMKKISDDPDNPFGSTIRQRHYTDSSGKTHLSALNIVSSGEKVNEEGRWGEWSKSLSSQMLSKQPYPFAKKQLGQMYNTKKTEFDEIMSLTNPTVRRKLLEGFADDCDSAAVHLKAAALPRQKTHVILPFPKMKETEIYAPNYKDGERVVLIRHPHGGRFEIPELVVNNKQKDAKRLIPNAIDAVGIHPKVAERLSGADFDGDTVIVIPNPKGYIKSSAPLKGLKDFDTREAYPPYPGMKPMTAKTKALKMGDVSNLITDMTIKGATPSEVVRAVRHSMVVIDAEKHNLNYKQSYLDHGIASLKKKYQGSERAGASTLISRASSQKMLPHREEGAKILNPKTGNIRRVYVDPLTGKKLYNETGETYTNKQGKIIRRTTRSTKMAEVDDPFKLSSGTSIEAVYASHATQLKRLALTARKTAVNTPYIPYSPSAKKVYELEVASLKGKLNIALKNAPLERQAQLLANSVVAAKKRDNPDMDPSDLKTIKGQALDEARHRVGAKKKAIPITPGEWEAIQAGAVNTNTLTQILNNTDMDKIKQLATPRTRKELSTAMVSRAKSMAARGKTYAEIADALGISTAKLIEVL